MNNDTRIKDYCRQIIEVYHGGSWQGESFLDKLKVVDESNAFKRPLPNIHAVAEIIWHCIYWRTTLIKNIQGELGYRDNTVEQLNFLPLKTLQEKSWAVLLNEFQQSQSLLLELLQQQTDPFLLKEYKSGRRFEFLTEGIIQHDIYHLGQLGLIIKMLGL